MVGTPVNRDQRPPHCTVAELRRHSQKDQEYEIVLGYTVSVRLELHRKILSQKERKENSKLSCQQSHSESPPNSIFIYLTKLQENGPQRNNFPQNALMRCFVTN